MSKCIIIDYGMGNLYSVKTAVEYLGYEAIVTDDYKKILSNRILILPGVGSFKIAINRIKKLNLNNVIKDFLSNKKNKILGICLGMQLLAKIGTEDGISDGLNIINCTVEKFKKNNDSPNFKIPHVGFNQVNTFKESILFKNIENNSDFYFNHSYYIPISKNESFSYSTTNYINNFVSSIEKSNVFATQFHPEKSQTNGQILLKNFLEI